MQSTHLASGRRRLLLAALGAMTMPAIAQGQKFPARPVKMVVPQPPGGAADRLARMLGERLDAHWKQSVVVENKPGGGVVVGTQAVVRAPADGYTIGLLGSSLSINAVQRKDLPYEVKDLQPLARVGYYTVALVAAANFPGERHQGPDRLGEEPTAPIASPSAPTASARRRRWRARC